MQQDGGLFVEEAAVFFVRHGEIQESDEEQRRTEPELGK
jgi:hypothetical protein